MHGLAVSKERGKSDRPIDPIDRSIDRTCIAERTQEEKTKTEHEIRNREQHGKHIMRNTSCERTPRPLAPGMLPPPSLLARSWAMLRSTWFTLISFTTTVGAAGSSAPMGLLPWRIIAAALEPACPIHSLNSTLE